MPYENIPEPYNARPTDKLIKELHVLISCIEKPDTISQHYLFNDGLEGVKSQAFEIIEVLGSRCKDW
jgi:hypothetical protein